MKTDKNRNSPSPQELNWIPFEITTPVPGTNPIYRDSENKHWTEEWNTTTQEKWDRFEYGSVPGPNPWLPTHPYSKLPATHWAMPGVKLQESPETIMVTASLSQIARARRQGDLREETRVIPDNVLIPVIKMDTGDISFILPMDFKKIGHTHNLFFNGEEHQPVNPRYFPQPQTPGQQQLYGS